jgi:hypothetical protein
MMLAEENEMRTSVDDTYYAQAEESVTDKVVYLLGAGFSAPLGLPVMSNFLAKSKDMYFSYRDRFEYFPKVFDTIREMSVSKNYYDADLFNIEEILSILEMRELVEGGRLKRSFVRYIIDVIEHSTPPVQDRRRDLRSRWHGEPHRCCPQEGEVDLGGPWNLAPLPEQRGGDGSV